ncbi:hypothetical protein EDD41_0791 [Luteococcus japonicus]|uniref:Uncharacterized protein n=1 Tax=Luteococcus japonicus TaxID=33984 RepID=A0A3N1ZSA9_9ACTN|nr:MULTISPECIES: hypothetical protein [Luteococcus]MDN5562808.1 hypothetical protein [Luteococcus sp.]ROR53628.1 hypothetical protein EDD41_0791 [Luteococcus japonicus]
MSALPFLHALESTFPGWPEYTPVSTGHMLLLTLGAPLLIGLVITGLIVGTSRRKELHASSTAAGMYDPEPAESIGTARPQRAVESATSAHDEPRGGATAALRGV